jgi:hypothetical protein
VADDRKCDLGAACHCVTRGFTGCGFHFDHEKMDKCDHFHMPCPPIVQSKQDRLRTTRQTWDKRRDKMMREAEKRIGRVGTDRATEDKLAEIRQNPRKHLRRKGVKT